MALKKIKLSRKISTKLILSMSFILVLMLGVYTYVTINSLASNMTYINYQNAYNISDLIKKSMRYSMLLNRREDIIQIMKMLGTEKGVRGIRVYNKQGLIIFSTDSTEIFKKVNTSSEACIGCHVNSKPLVKLSNENKMRIYRDAAGRRILGVINPIRNESDCSSGSCHAHSAQTEVLGVLDVMISLDQLDKIIARNTHSTLINGLLITVVISFFCGLFITFLVNKPLKKLTKGLDEIGEGNLSYKIPIHSQDELGQVAVRFNEMSSNLEEARRQLENWSDDLNKKVMQKSEELKKVYQQVVEIEKLASLGKLSATVAHELNNPLEGILTYSKLIKRKLIENGKQGEFSKLIDYLNLISDESSRCGKIVKDLLLFSHKEDNEFYEESLVSIVDRSILVIRHHLEVNKIELVRKYQAEKVRLYCSPSKIQQAVMSLLINALEAMPYGGKVEVITANENDTLVLRISDTGSGISEKDLPHIFEPFFTTKEPSKGTGLGLSIVYGIINYHNGFVEVEQTSEAGTTFKVTLPLNFKKYLS